MTQREKILDLASQMFIREGVKAVRMDDIAHRAVISKRTLYELFSDKESLLFEAMQLHFERSEVEMQRISDAAPNVLISIVEIMYRISESSKDEWRLRNELLRFYPDLYHRLVNLKYDVRRNGFKLTLERGVAEGLVVERANLDLAVTMLHYISTSVAMGDEELVLPEGVTAQDAFLEVTINFMRGISTARGIELIDTYINERANRK